MLDISKLINDSEEILQINETIEFKEDDLKNTDIKRLENIKAVGTINRVNNNVFHIRLNITGTMVLTCARSLEEVPQKLDIFINQNIDDKENIEEKPLILQNTLDIFSIVWENIVLEVPLRVVKEDANFLSSGDGWSLCENAQETNNSPFEGLLNILDMEGKE